MDSNNNGGSWSNPRPENEPLRAYGQGCCDYDDRFAYNQQIRADQMRRRINRPDRVNGFGIAGFVLALSSWGFFWLPISGLLLWLLALIFSIIGMSRRPRAFGIAGFVLCVTELAATVILLLMFGGLFIDFLSR